MSQSSNSGTQILFSIFGIALGLTILIWALRGFGILTFIPGSVIWILIFLTVTSGILSRLLASRGRY